MREIDYWIWISSLVGIGPVKAKNLLERYKDPKLIYHMSECELKQTGFLTAKNIEELLDMGKRQQIKKINDLMIKNDIKMINIFDAQYPQKLKHIYDPPIAIYYKGKIEICDLAVAIVGSRKTTNYGAMSARKLSYELALRGIQIVSGLARGIDSIAHEGCLDAGGKTIAVLGCGLDNIYPPENKRLYENIIKTGGLVISEYVPGTPPLQYNFPARNRIISGISSGVLVVEAAKRSGSLITASYALEQGREVFAVPGNIDCAYSRGTNQLIKDGAKMVLSILDILEEFDYKEEPDYEDKATHNKKENTDYMVYRGLSTEEIRIVKVVMSGIRNIDEIIDRSNISAKDVNNILFMLEMKGVLCQLPGKIFEICN